MMASEDPSCEPSTSSAMVALPDLSKPMECSANPLYHSLMLNWSPTCSTYRVSDDTQILKHRVVARSKLAARGETTFMKLRGPRGSTAQAGSAIGRFRSIG